MDYKKFGFNLVLIGLLIVLASGIQYAYWSQIKEGQSAEASKLRDDVLYRGSMSARMKLDAMYARDKTRPSRIDYTLYIGLAVAALGVAVRSSAK